MDYLNLNEFQKKLSTHFRPWQRSFQFWLRATDIYTVIGKPDLALAAWVTRLITLCNQAPTTPLDAIQVVLENELGQCVDELFERFDADPIGSTSIAQIHRARLKGDKTDVVVKKHIGFEFDFKTEIAKSQHYELPTSFFKLVLGKHLKYSCGLFIDASKTLEDAEKVMLELYCERAQIKDGHSVLDGFATQRHREHILRSSLDITMHASFHRDLQLQNLEVIVADIGTFDMDASYGRIFSIEMLEHMKNYKDLLKKISKWIKPDSLLLYIISAIKHLLITLRMSMKMTGLLGLLHWSYDPPTSIRFRSTPMLHKFFPLAWHNVQRNIILQIRIRSSRLEILGLNLILVILPYAVADDDSSRDDSCCGATDGGRTDGRRGGLVHDSCYGATDGGRCGGTNGPSDGGHWDASSNGGTSNSGRCDGWLNGGGTNSPSDGGRYDASFDGDATDVLISVPDNNFGLSLTSRLPSNDTLSFWNLWPLERNPNPVIRRPSY
ncbi:hypothetical protein HYC85_023059 [Camellia sinensis]|uniref:ABC1 atypical kinase-like domain-containing protein n=1 Tax=Camellia sinensis TaxID=4442 RepID=A0A7J7GDI6_CAMSI|nr:hypothetical protein HYC85_023059 [Camellia sinensis]